MVTTSFPRQAMVVGSLVALTLAALSGSPAVSMTSAIVLIAACVAVPAVMFLMGTRGLPPTVANVLQSANSRSAKPPVDKREASDVTAGRS